MNSRLLIIDDDPEIASALVRGLALHGYEAEAVNRAQDGLAAILGGGFEGAIIDVMLGADSGLDLVRAARAQGATLPILMLSALSEVEDRAAGLEAGANDYIVKPFSFYELVARLGVQKLRSLKDQPVPARLDRVGKTLSRGGTCVDLTDREAELLMVLRDHAGTPVSRGTIFDTLWAGDGSTNENVVDVYIGYLRKKLSGHDFGMEIKTIRTRGFLLDGMPPDVTPQ